MIANILDTLQITKRQLVYLILAGICVFFAVFFISRCEQDAQLADQLKANRKQAQLDSTIVASRTEAAFYHQLTAQYKDSLAAYKQKVATLDAKKQTKLIQYEKPIIQYRAAVAHNPDSARQSFLSKRFPDLYPH